MKLFRFFLTEATEAVTEGAEATGSPLGGMVDMMDLILVVMLWVKPSGLFGKKGG